MRTTFPAAFLLLVTACSSGGADSDDAVTIEQLADDIGCTDLAVDEDPQMFTEQSGSCSLDGTDVYLHTFADDTAQTNWLDAAEIAGGAFVEGESWVVQAFDDEAADQVADATGGKVASANGYRDGYIGMY